MIEEYAIVTGNAESCATLELERPTACGLCGQKRGCGNATWGKFLGHKRHEFIAKNPINAKIGESVIVGIDEQIILNSVFFLYIIPLLGLLLGAVFADMFFKSQLYVLLSSVSGLILGFLWVKGYLTGNSGGVKKVLKSNYQAVILRYADKEVND